MDAPLARDWWKLNAARFDPAKRYQAGLCVSDDPLGPVFDQLRLAIRYDVYLRERSLTPGTMDWELETWTWKQRSAGKILPPSVALDAGATVESTDITIPQATLRSPKRYD